VYLQQNAFDKVDEFTPKERQQYVFDFLIKILEKDFVFSNKDEARKEFLDLRQLFINWNSSEFEGEDFKRIEKEMSGKLEIDKGTGTPRH